LIDRKKSNANPDTSARGKKGLARLPVDALPGIESEIGERFRDWAMLLVTDERWNRYRTNAESGNLRVSLVNLTRVFCYDYAELLGRAVVEFVEELIEVLLKWDIPRREIECQGILDTSFRFADRFTQGQYAKPWTGIFVLYPRPSDPRSKLPLPSHYWPDKHAEKVDFQKMYVLDGLFREAEARATPEEVARARQVAQEIGSSQEWKSRAAHRAENQFQYAYPTPSVKSPMVRNELDQVIYNLRKVHSRWPARQICSKVDQAFENRQRNTPLRESWRRHGHTTLLDAYDCETCGKDVGVRVSQQKPEGSPRAIKSSRPSPQ
jgi:hypothetical protein